MNPTFSSSTRIYSRLGALSDAAQILRGFNVSRVLVVADSGLDRLGMLETILDQAGVRDLIVGKVLIDVNPTPIHAESAAVEARALGAQAVLAVGGGSGLSAAKAVALLMTNDVSIADLVGQGKAAHLPAPTVAVPTTAGSGSEVSNALVLHELGQIREIVIRGNGYEPVAAILDATVLRGLPKAPLVFAALDALTHALESLWSRGRSLFTDACALRAASEIIGVLPVAVSGQANGTNVRGENDEVLQRLLEAASLANIACGNSGLALVHALSSSPAVDLPHGLQNGILLPQIAQFNREVLSVEGREIVDRLPELYDLIKFDSRLDLGSAEVESMIEASRGHVFRQNNARESTDEELRRLLQLASESSAEAS
jgi:alcohol dehydrogenase class IV